MAPNVVTPLHGITKHFAKCEVVHDADATIAAQVAQAKQSDVAIIVVGYTKEEEGEFIGDSEDTAPMVSLIPRQDDPELAREYEKYMHENHHYAPDELRIKSRNGTFSTFSFFRWGCLEKHIHEVLGIKLILQSIGQLTIIIQYTFAEKHCGKLFS